MNSDQSHVIGFAFAQRAMGCRILTHMDRPTAPPSKSARSDAKILELPYRNPEGRAVAELRARVGARVVGEHRHPGIVERFTVLEGELTVKRADQTSILRQGESAIFEADIWHDWWNASDRDARVRVEVTPGERFAHMIETLFGLRGLGIPTPRVCRIYCNSHWLHESSAT